MAALFFTSLAVIICKKYRIPALIAIIYRYDGNMQNSLIFFLIMT